MQFDLAERANVADRARHMEIFEQLRALQAQQREQLIRDQQEQWSRLQAGQRATEARLIAQRQSQWGSKTGMTSTKSNEIEPQTLVSAVRGLECFNDWIVE